MEKKEMEFGVWVENEGSQGIWLPKEKGDVLQGKVVELRQGIYGIQLLVKDEKENIQTTPSHKALQSRLGGIQVGDFVRIVLQGTDLPKVKGHKPTMLYKVFVKRIQEDTL